MPDFLAEVLTWPKNYGYALAVRSALEWHIPPTTLIVAQKQPTDPWTMADKKLAVAFTILQRETCKECGQPLWICRSSNKNLLFKVRKDTCYSKRELEVWSKKNAKNLKPGEHTYVIAEMRNDEEMPSRREYLEALED